LISQVEVEADFLLAVRVKIVLFLLEGDFFFDLQIMANHDEILSLARSDVHVLSVKEYIHSHHFILQYVKMLLVSLNWDEQRTN
jgi:hypothetical protein